MSGSGGRTRTARVRALAKINLDLRVLGKRADGFHELRTVFQTISLADSIELAFTPGRKTQVELQDSLAIPDNIVTRAARLALDAMRAAGRVEMRLTKRIPMGAGLGGGSSDAAAVLLALPALAGKALPLAALSTLAASLGSDVPFFLLGGTAVGIGRGTELFPLPDAPARQGILVAPGVHVSTAEAYAGLSPRLTSESLENKIFSFQSFAWDPGRPGLAANDFEPVVFERHGRLSALKRSLAKAGARTAMMTGSGFGPVRIVRRARRGSEGPAGAGRTFGSARRREGVSFFAGRTRPLPLHLAARAARPHRYRIMAAPKPVHAMSRDTLKIFSGNANQELAREICVALGMELGDAMVRQFSDGEIYLQIKENVRGADVFIIQPTCTPVDRNLMELLLMLDALKRASADRITAVLPYYGYARQDRKDKPRVPISARLVAGLLETAGADRILALDLHAAQIQGFFNIPVDHLFASPVMIEHFKAQNLEDLTVVSPDAGGVERARAFAKRLSCPLAIVDKRREEANIAEVMNVVGDVKGRRCLIVDDLVDTAGSLVKGAEALLAKGAASVSACATHAVLSGPAVSRIEASRLQELVFSNSIPLSEEAKNCSRIKSLSIARLLAEAIRSIHLETSVSVLFV